ncbi:MAG: hypothetical protein IRY99_27450 [Isosphaeraceae bacterium]|nr:hypothetical protein [Isosphaeraceae bacterium]
MPQAVKVTVAAFRVDIGDLGRLQVGAEHLRSLLAFSAQVPGQTFASAVRPAK